MSKKVIKVDVAADLYVDKDTGETVYVMFEKQSPYNEDRDLVHVEYRSPPGIPVIEEHIEAAHHDFVMKLSLADAEPLTISTH